MHRALRAFVGGSVATAVMTIALLVMDVETRAQLGLFEALARFFGMPNQVGLGFLAFLAFGVFVWPLVFAAVESHIPPRKDVAVRGMLFGAALWVAFAVIATAELQVILVFLYAALTLFAHLLYGFTLGLVYGWTDRIPAENGVALHPQANGDKE